MEGRIDFPLSINMLPYTTKQYSKSIDRSKFIYDLSSAVVHKGKLDAGHYYAYCRHGDEVRLLFFFFFFFSYLSSMSFLCWGYDLVFTLT